MSELSLAKKSLRKLASKEKAEFLAKYFKTSKGEYGAGDIFIGVKVPDTRKVAKQFRALSLPDITKLLKSKIHEERLLALEILTIQFEKGDSKTQKSIFGVYIKNLKFVNNWDLVDGSAPEIAGPYMHNKSKALLYTMAKSKNIWRRRVAMLTCFYFIRQKDYKDALKIAEILKDDHEDLIHKAVGWMLREVGNRDRLIEEAFLKKHYKKMPRTMLRYATEKFEEPLRQKYLKGLV